MITNPEPWPNPDPMRPGPRPSPAVGFRQAFAAKYHVGRYVVWSAACALVAWAAALLVLALFHPPLWLVFGSATVLGAFIPDPKWVKR